MTALAYDPHRPVYVHVINVLVVDLYLAQYFSVFTPATNGEVKCWIITCTTSVQRGDSWCAFIEVNESERMMGVYIQRIGNKIGLDSAYRISAEFVATSFVSVVAVKTWKTSISYTAPL